MLMSRREADTAAKVNLRMEMHRPIILDDVDLLGTRAMGSNLLIEFDQFAHSNFGALQGEHLTSDQAASTGFILKSSSLSYPT